MHKQAKVVLVKIENWSIITPPISKNVVLHGTVTGHSRVADGSTITTTQIIGVDGRYVYTLNSTYLLGKPSAEFVQDLHRLGLRYNALTPLKPSRIETK